MIEQQSEMRERVHLWWINQKLPDLQGDLLKRCKSEEVLFRNLNEMVESEISLAIQKRDEMWLKILIEEGVLLREVVEKMKNKIK